MVRAKKMFMKLFLIVEMIAFGNLYFFGKNGMQVLQQKRTVVVQLEQNIEQLTADIAQLEKEMHAWQTDDFYKEKVAREQLQMARAGDELFYVGA